MTTASSKRVQAIIAKSGLGHSQVIASGKRALRVQAVIDKTGLGRSTIYAMMKADRFPAPIKLGHRAVGWLEDDIDLWLDVRAIASEAA
jgi:prophage regulatory protein